MKRFLSTAAFIAFLSPFAAGGAEALKPHGEFYAGPKTLVVEIAYLEGDKEALVGISGVNSALDGKVLRTKIESVDSGKDFVTTLDGKPYTLLTIRKSYAGETINAFLPESKQESLRLTIDSEKSKEENPAKLRDLYETQK